MKKMTMILLMIISFTLLNLEAYQTDVRPPYPWPESTPEAQGIDSRIIERALELGEQRPSLNCLLITRNGFLIGEKYYHFITQEEPHLVASVSKSFLSSLIGLAIENGFIPSIEKKIMDYFPDYAASVADPRFFDITIQHLLTMTAGLPGSEIRRGIKNSYEIALWSSSDHLRFIFERSLANPPGELFWYSNAGTHLLAVILARATGMSALEFADLYLFEPLNISVSQWNQDPQGYYYGGFDMYFYPRDMARFGELFLHKGEINGLQIFPESWIEESTGFQVEASDGFTYGYLWWRFSILDYDVYFAWGYGGQFIMNIPDLNMTFVTIGRRGQVRLDAGINSDHFFKLLIYQLLFPIHSFLGDPPYSPLEARAEKVENRSLFFTQYINILRWNPNPANNAVNINRYRIYQLERRIVDLLNNNWILLAEVNTGTTEYRHLVQDEEQRDYYAVSAVTDDGRESLIAVAGCQYPVNK
jgi:CubicO group peptidase (beta-lactamase class C family)